MTCSSLHTRIDYEKARDRSRSRLTPKTAFSALTDLAMLGLITIVLLALPAMQAIDNGLGRLPPL
jgi:hypothetical protein